ncbi:efflux RND transporter permease subunit [Roseicitreum antarcticum]|uniref:Multidrug efflux pump subunit AcrB n=1 Tax=Roseicitreum antarcticum TaxID=564137 RepID=A0A1H2RK47_9RHOB|nr:efflux RND transporter permease subunit [Roseicitreum antarcticum]SDW19747.1 Multidrug efflux pump subunit AcrB [Roseicitreum antarcticum]
MTQGNDTPQHPADGVPKGAAAGDAPDTGQAVESATAAGTGPGNTGPGNTGAGGVTGTPGPATAGPAQHLRVRALGVFRYFTRHRTAANLLLVLMLAAGIVAIPNMRAQFFPDVVVDSITTTVSWPGAGAGDVDAGIVQVLVPALSAVEGVTETSARASEGRATISLEFESGWDMGRAATDVQDAMDTAGTLPEGAEDPRIRRSNWGERVTNVVITGPVSVDQLALFADEFTARLYAEGVTRTSVEGVAAPEIRVEVPSRNLVQYDVSMAEIAQVIGAGTFADPTGDLASGTARIRTGTDRRGVADIAALALRSNPDGSSLTVGDVASVSAGAVDRDRAYFVGDSPAVTLEVQRSERGDAIDIQNIVQRVADEMVLSLPEGVSIDLTSTRAEVISGRLNILVTNAVMGLGLVVVLLFLFLNTRTAFWVAAGIPVAMLAAVAAMYLMGLSFNMISLFALIITLGIVVDDAIVVGEHADYRYRELHESPAQAAENAATRMAQPVLAATITTVIAFGALTVIGGRFGTLIADIPLTVIAVLLASLVECFLILPNHMHHALVGAAKEHWYDWPSRQVNRGFQWVRDRAFRPVMGLVVQMRYPVLAGLVALLAMQGAQIINGNVPFRFFNSPEQGSVTGNFTMVPGATREDSIEMVRELQRATAALAERYAAEDGTNPVVYAMAEIGGNSGRPLASAENKGPDLLGAISIDLVDADFRSFSSFEFTSALQDEVRPHPRLEEFSFRSWGQGPGGDSLSVDLSGSNSDTLKAAAEALKTALAPYPEITALEDSLPYDKAELVLELTPQGQALGFSTDALARDLRHRLSGIEAASFPDGLREAVIRVELPEAEQTADFLETTLLRSASGQYLPLGDIVTVQERQGFSTIRRENGLRIVTVSGDLSEDDPARAREILLLLEDEILPMLRADFGVETRLSGLAEQEQAFLSDAAYGVMLCLLAIYLTLAWVFSSWLRPMVVMAVIPFGLIGAIYGHAAWGMALSLFSIVGLIGMVGIIINDSIVLVTTVDEYAQERGLLPSIVDAACDRLRPVLLTTLTTVLGLSPLLFEGSSQAEFLKPTVITLVYGLGFGMVLVLLVVPAMLGVGHDLGRLAGSVRRSLRLPRGGQGVAGMVPLALAGALLALFAATLGHVMVTGAVWIPVWAGVSPLLPDMAPARAALVVFALGAIVLTALAWLAGALAVWLGARRAVGRMQDRVAGGA